VWSIRNAICARGPRVFGARQYDPAAAVTGNLLLCGGRVARGVRFLIHIPATRVSTMRGTLAGELPDPDRSYATVAMECASVRCGAADVHGTRHEMSVCPVYVGKKLMLMRSASPQ